MKPWIKLSKEIHLCFLYVYVITFILIISEI